MNRILLVEDNEANIKLFISILERIGVVTDVAKTGPEAVKYATQNMYDLILMDVGLPVHDGLEATRQIRAAASPYSDATIYALTADDDQKMKDDCAAVRMNVFLIKPISPITLMKKVQEIVAGSPQKDVG